MKIGIDARMLGKGHGIGRYIEQMILHLAEIDTQNQYVLFLKQDNFNQLELPENFKKVLADIHWYTLKEQFALAKIIKQEKVDLMHFSHWNIPYFYSDPFVLTIHDLIMFHYPRAEATTLGPIKFFIKDQAHRLLLKKITKTVAHILTTSEFTKQDIHKTLRVPLEKMTVTYQAPFDKEQKTKNKEQIDEILQKFNITKPYVLYVGAAYPHKNLETLIDAWKVFEEKYGLDYQLVMAGKESLFYDRVKSKAQKISFRNPPVFTGFVPDEELSSLYQSASLYVFPSLYEGFGLPPLEAMQYGIPVAASNASCLPEVLQAAAIYFDPTQKEQISQVLYKGTTDKNVRSELLSKAFQVLSQYSWKNLALETHKIYTQTLENK